MLALKILVYLLLVCMVYSQMTKRENILLSRKKRYLTFPDGSNFVITLSLVKAMLFDYPKAVNIIGECDVPFKLPNDARWFKKNKYIHHIQKRDVYSTLELALSEHGFNGTSCVKRMICEAKLLLPHKGKSLISDLLSAIFTFDDNMEENRQFKDYCSNYVFDECEVPLLKYILGNSL